MVGCSEYKIGCPFPGTFRRVAKGRGKHNKMLGEKGKSSKGLSKETEGGGVTIKLPFPQEES